MKNFKQNPLGRTVAAGLGIVLVAGVSLVAAAPAQAYGDTPVYASEIRADETTYTGWHQGYKDGIAAVTAEGLELTGASQIINGLATPASIDDLRGAAYGNSSWTTTADSAPAFFQIPVSFGESGFTTLRPANPVAGKNTVDGEDDWSTSRAIGDIAANSVLPLFDLIGAIDAQTNVKVLGFGVLSIPGPASVVTGISWAGSNYSFLQDPIKVGTVTLTGDAVVGSKLTVTTAGWPAGTTFSYNWGWNTGAMGGPIDEAQGPDATSYTVTKDVIGRHVVVVVTGTVEGFSPDSVLSNETDWITAPQAPAAAAPVANSADLAAFLAAEGVTPQTQTEAGLPAGDLNPGSSYTANVTWTSRDSFVDVYAYSTPILVGSFPVVDGVAKITLSPKVLGQLAAGAHTLVITGQTSGDVQAVSLSIAATLAETGSNAVAPITASALLLLLGGALVAVRRRRAHV